MPKPLPVSPRRSQQTVPGPGAVALHAYDDFRRWWGDHHIATRSKGSKVLHHPAAGELTVDRGALTCTTDPDQQLVVWTAEPGIPSHDGLRILASWAAEHPEPRPENGRSA